MSIPYHGDIRSDGEKTADEVFDKHAAELDAALSPAPAPAKLTAEEWAEAVYVKSQLLESLSNRGRWLEQHGHDLAKFIREQERARIALVQERDRERRISELKSAAVDRWVPCPDHRDKVDHRKDRCSVCRAEAAEAERDALRVALVHVAFGMKQEPQHMLMPGLTLINNDEVHVKLPDGTVVTALAAPPAADAKETGR